MGQITEIRNYNQRRTCERHGRLFMGDRRKAIVLTQMINVGTFTR
jgi:hypothetical protein